MNSLLIKSSEKGVKFHRSQVHKAVRNPSQRNVYKWLSNNAYVKINVHVLTANLNLQLNYYLSKILNTLIKILLIILNSRSFGKLFVQIAAASFTERIVNLFHAGWILWRYLLADALRYLTNSHSSGLVGAPAQTAHDTVGGHDTGRSAAAHVTDIKIYTLQVLSSQVGSKYTIIFVNIRCVSKGPNSGRYSINRVQIRNIV